MQNNQFIGYKTVSESQLRSADCLCYKLFPSIQDVVFNYKKNVEYSMFGSLRMGFENHFILTSGVVYEGTVKRIESV